MRSASGNPRKAFGILALGAVCAVLGMGCGDAGSTQPTGTVVVKVTYGGAPVTAGRVDLSNPQTGQGGGADLDTAGIARIEGVALGNYTVTVQPPPPSPADLAPPEPGQPPRTMPSHDNIPQQYRRMETSPLKIDVQSGTAEQAFDLKQ